jgi:peptidoglycan/LPS O-acetylase OafA/YrhL
MASSVTLAPGTLALRSISESRPPARKHQVIPELDGVRGIAILLVLLFHLELSYPPAVPRAFFAPLLLGWSGVDLFFVLSGFLITEILIDTRECRNYFSSFYMRRVLRIMPLYLLAVCAYFLVALPVAHHLGYWRARDASAQMWFWLHLSNWPPASGTVVPLIGHVWSLSVEEQFYLAWPLVVLLVRPSRLIYVCCGVVAAALALRVAFVNGNFVYYLTPFRMDALGVGCLVVTIVRNKVYSAVVQDRWRWIVGSNIAVLLVVVAIARSSRPFNPWMSTVGYTCFALVYGSLVFAAYSQAGTGSWLAMQLRRPFLRSFGKYSYAIYVFHAAIATALNHLRIELSQNLPVYNSVYIAVYIRVFLAILCMAASVAASYGAARVSWYVLEKRCLALKKYFTAVG